MFKVLIDFLFPRTCLGCGRQGEYLCSDCVNFIKTNDQPICPICLRLSPGGLTHPSCRRAQGLDGLTAVFVYRGIMRQAIAKLKYRFAYDLAGTILEIFLSFCGEDKAFCKFVTKKNVFLVPVPLHWQRKNWRGFNQAELLGQKISQKLGIGFLPDLLIRTRYTPPQIKLKKEDRAENIKGAFAINKKINKKSLNILISQYPNILLFDDVWTTGATMKECAKVLKQAGYKSVWGLTLCR